MARSPLVADISPALSSLVQTVGTKQQRDAAEAERQRQQQIQELVAVATGAPAPAPAPEDPGVIGGIAETLSGLFGGEDTGAGVPAVEQVAGAGVPAAPSPLSGKRQQNALARLSAIDPTVAKNISGIIESGNEQSRLQIKQQAETGLRQAAFVSKQPDFASKQRAIQSLAQEAAGRGEPLDRFIQLQNLSEDELDLELERMKVMGTDIDTLAAGPGAGDFSKAPGVLTRNEDGSVAFSIPVLDKTTGTFTNQVVPIAGEVVSRLGETGVEESLRKAGQAGLAETNQLKAQLELQPQVTGATKQAAAEEARVQGIINRGLDAADTVPILNRSIELLDAVKTGGINAASLRAKQLFGVEGADEAELSSNLGKTVLSQLRSTFGAAFTEREGARLATIEAGFGKSAAGNRRLLQQTLRIANKAANRAIKASEKRGDTDTAQEIRDSLSFSLSEPGPAQAAPTPAAPGTPAAPTPQAAPVAPTIQEGATATNPATGETIVFRNGQWLPQ